MFCLCPNCLHLPHLVFSILLFFFAVPALAAAATAAATTAASAPPAAAPPCFQYAFRHACTLSRPLNVALTAASTRAPVGTLSAWTTTALHDPMALWHQGHSAGLSRSESWLLWRAQLWMRSSSGLLVPHQACIGTLHWEQRCLPGLVRKPRQSKSPHMKGPCSCGCSFASTSTMFLLVVWGWHRKHIHLLSTCTPHDVQACMSDLPPHTGPLHLTRAVPAGAAAALCRSQLPVLVR